MPNTSALYTFRHTEEFDASRGALDDEALRWVQATLCANPEAGAVVRGTGGVRKLRVALPGRGKSGGARVLYYFQPSRERHILLLAYAKNEADSISDAGKKYLKNLVQRLEAQP
jgi:hypothetical protein